MNRIKRVSASSISVFSQNVTTEQLHGISDRGKVSGPYAHLRSAILSDSDHHKNYTKERSWLQDAIVDEILENVEDRDVCFPDQPWLIFTVGARGAGKIHTVHDLVSTGRLPFLSFIQVDPDAIRRRLPEFKTYDKDQVSCLTRQESLFIAELLLLAAIQQGRNVVYDSAMHNPDWYLKLIGRYGKCLVNSVSCMKFAILHITAPTELIFQRANVRYHPLLF